MTQPRKHHYVPQFYLAGFTKNDNKDGRLFVFDIQQKKSWASTPKRTAHKRDFYRVEAGAGGDPMAIEKALSQLETRWKAALTTVIETRTLPDGDEFADLMIFVAFLAVRVPRIREKVADFVDRVSKTQIRAMFATKEGQEKVREILAEHGHEMSDEEFAQVVQFGVSDDYDVDYEPSWHVREMVRMAATLAPLLSLRKWRLWEVDAEAPDLICCDCPVVPAWRTPMPGLTAPAFGTPNTIVSVPLNRRMVLVSMIEEELPPETLDLEGVARINSMTGRNANQIYSSENDFVWMMRDYRVGKSAQLLEALGEAAQAKDAGGSVD